MSSIRMNSIDSLVPRTSSVTITDVTVHLARSHGSIVEALQVALAPAEPGRISNQPRLNCCLAASPYFFLGAGLAVEACCFLF
jgi:hypothetical protein